MLSKYQSKCKIGQQTSSYCASLGLTLLEFNYDKNDLLSKFDLFIHSTIGKGHTKSELDYYLDELVLPRISDLNVLSW